VTNLSPAARAVLDAFVGDPTERDELEDDRRYLAAALRAAADQVLAVQWEGRIEPDTAHSLGVNWTRDALLAIADELEGSHG
jgi:hypothetical protein